MQIKHVARIRLAAGGALEHERHLAVGDRVLGQIVVNDQRVHAVVHEPFAHRAPANGARYWFVAESDAEATTIMV